ncbi:MAG: LON peptidase substrate-binding domain-containing protein, partial [Deinococcales bacterium]
MDWELPVIALRTQVVLPRTLENVDVGRPKSKRALEEAQAADNRVLLVVQREGRIDDPSGEDLFDVGTLCVIKQVIRLPDDTLQVLVEGRERARIDNYLAGTSLRAQVTTIPEVTTERPESNALVEQAKQAFAEYAQQNKNLRLDSFHLENLRGLREAGPLADVIAKYATWEVADKQAVLEQYDIIMWDVMSIDYNAGLSGERVLQKGGKLGQGAHEPASQVRRPVHESSEIGQIAGTPTRAFMQCIGGEKGAPAWPAGSP